MNYCRRCGTSLTNENEHVFICQNGHRLFANSSPTVGVFVLTESNTVLLSRRGIEPRKGMLDSFGGFIDPGESYEQAAIRELSEETGLTTDQLTPLEFLCSAPGNYPYQKDVLPVLSVFFVTHLNEGVNPIAKDDVAEIVELAPETIDMGELHDDDIRAGLTSLINYLKEIV